LHSLFKQFGACFLGPSVALFADGSRRLTAGGFIRVGRCAQRRFVFVWFGHNRGFSHPLTAQSSLSIGAAQRVFSRKAGDYARPPAIQKIHRRQGLEIPHH
jgi:hypothetical protein